MTRKIKLSLLVGEYLRNRNLDYAVVLYLAAKNEEITLNQIYKICKERTRSGVRSWLTYLTNINILKRTAKATYTIGPKVEVDLEEARRVLEKHGINIERLEKENTLNIIVESDERIRELEKQINQLEEEKKRLKEELSKTRDENTRLRQEVAKLREENERLRRDISRIRADYEELWREREEYRYTIEKLSKFRNDIKTLLEKRGILRYYTIMRKEGKRKFIIISELEKALQEIEKRNDIVGVCICKEKEIE